MKNETLVQEFARDLLALGSLPFYLIVLVRSTIGEHEAFVMQVGLSLLIITILDRIAHNQRVSRSLILIISTSLFYKDLGYTLFVSVTWIGIVWAARQFDDWKYVIRGVFFGLLAMALSYYASTLV